MNHDRITELYEGRLDSKDAQLRARRRIHWLCAQVKGNRVLDVGCSQGIASILLAREGRRVVGIDHERSAIVFALERLKEEEPEVQERISFDCAEAAALPFPDRSFDSVLLGEVLEHLVDPEAVVRQVARVLRPQGRVAITVPYGIFRYPDHKEPLYLEPLLELLCRSLAVRGVELIDRHLGIVGSPRGRSRPLGREVLAQALSAAEQRLRQVDELGEAQRGTMRKREEMIETLKASAVELQDEVDRLRAGVAALQHEKAALVEEVEDRTQGIVDMHAEPSPAPPVPAWATATRLAHTSKGVGAGPKAALGFGAQAQEKDVDRSVAAARRAVDAAPRDARAWLELARAQRRARHLDDSVESARRALELRPEWEAAIWHVASVHAHRGDVDALVAAVDSLGPVAEHTDAGLRRAVVLGVRAAAWELVTMVAQELIVRHPTDEEGIFGLAVAAWEEGHEEEAEQVIVEALAGGGDAGVHAGIRFFQHVERLDSALVLLPKLSEWDSRVPFELAQRLLKRGRAADSLRLLDDVVSADPSHAGAQAARERAIGQLNVQEDRWRVTTKREPNAAVRGRVLHLLQRSLPYHSSGGSHRTHYTAKSQRALGLDPHLTTQLGFPWDDGIPSTSYCDVVDGIPYYRLKNGGHTSDRLDERLANNVALASDLVRQLGPSVLHPASDYFNAFVAYELRDRFGVPVVYEVRGFPEVRLVKRRRSRVQTDLYAARRELEARALAQADHIVTLADVMKQRIVSLGVPPEKITVVPNAVDSNTFRPVPRDDRLAAAVGIDPGSMVAGYVTTLNSYEGVPYLVRAVAELKRRGNRVSALIVGDGSDRSLLERMVGELDVSDRVFLVGRVPHDAILSYYSLIDVFVVPRTAEITCQLVTPLKPYEAMACGRAVVVSGTQALREMVIEGETGLVFEPENHLALAEVLESLAQDPQRRLELGANARDWVAGERTWQGNARRYAAVYEQLGAA